VNKQIVVRDFKYVGKICPLRIDHIIWCMCSGCKHTVDSILWEMSEVITHKWIAIGLSNLVERLPHDPPCLTSDQDQKVKAQGHKVT